MNERRSGKRTMLLSVLMSAPGPLVMGLGLAAGRSSTQIADFVRRSSELLAIVVAFAVYLITTKKPEEDSSGKEKLERLSNIFVGVMMCVGGGFMIVLTLLSRTEDKGNVLPALAIALLGLIANTLFWRKYTKLNSRQPNAILAVQARLYGAKSLVDGCVTAALVSVALAPASPVSVWLDRIGSVVVALYLIWCGGRTVLEALRKKKEV